VSAAALQGAAPATLRRGRIGDLDALVALENAVFTTDILSRRSFCRFLAPSSNTPSRTASRGCTAPRTVRNWISRPWASL
jgi:hypothetical protein